MNGPLAQIPHRNDYLNDSDDETSVDSSQVSTSMPKLVLETAAEANSASGKSIGIVRVPRYALAGCDYTVFIKAE